MNILLTFMLSILANAQVIDLNGVPPAHIRERRGCEKHADCKAPEGCYPFRPEVDLFRVPPNAKAQEIDQILWEEFFYRKFPERYKLNFPKQVCRVADVAEIPLKDGFCDEGLYLSNDGRCSPIAVKKKELRTYDTNVRSKGSCQFALSQDLETQAMKALRSIRGLEWIFSAPATGNVCYSHGGLLRKAAVMLFEGRRSILTEFNRELLKIEADTQLLLHARTDSSRTLSFQGVTMIERDIATRRSAGLDHQILLARRNKLSRDYEVSMADLIDKIQLELKSVLQERGHTKCTVPTGEVVGSLYLVSASGKNIQALSMQQVAAYLEELNPDHGRLRENFFMLDPPLPTAISFLDYGSTGKFATSSYIRFLDGVDERHSFMKLMQDLKKSLSLHRKGLNPVNMNGYAHEPELLNLNDNRTGVGIARDCTEESTKIGCEGMMLLDEELVQIGLAQILAFSYTGGRKGYENYFGSDTARIRLLNRFEDEMSILSQFYRASIEVRQKKHECLSKVIASVESDFLVTSEEGIVSEEVSLLENDSIHLFRMNFNTPNTSLLKTAELSQEEKDLILINIDRKRSRYESNVDDPLFDKISKAYHRNLRVLFN